MVNLLKSEFYKLFHSRSFWGIGLFNLFLSSVLLLDSKSVTANLLLASLYNIPLLYFLTIVFNALFVGDDFGKRTLHSYVNAGQKRGTILFTKALVYQAACILILVFPLCVHSLFGVFVLKESIVFTEGIFITGVVILMGIAAMCILPFFFAFLFRDMGRTLAIPMILFFLMIFLLNGGKAQTIGTILPMGQLRLVSLQQFPVSGVAFAGIDFVWVSVLYLMAYFVFRRSDLK